MMQTRHQQRRRLPQAILLGAPLALLILLSTLSPADAQGGNGGGAAFAQAAQQLAQRAAPLVRRAASAAAQQVRARAAAARESSQQQSQEAKPPVIRPDENNFNGGGHGHGGGGGFNNGPRAGGFGGGGFNGGGGFGGGFNGLNAAGLVGLAGTGVDAYTSLTAPIVTEIGSKIPVSVPAVFADGTVCRFGQPYQDPESGRLMCQLTDMGKVASYGYRALGVATNVGMQAANVFLGRRRLAMAAPSEAPTVAVVAAAVPTLDAQRALLAHIDLPSWAK